VGKFTILLLISLSYAAKASKLEDYFTPDNMSFKHKESFCVDKFNKSMKRLLQNDSQNLIAKSFNLASLKLAYRQLNEGQEKKTLESYIKNKVNELNLGDNLIFRQKVKELYEQNGEAKDLAEITKIIDGLDDKSYFPKAKRLSNKEGSVFMLALSMYDKCDDVSLCLDKNDAAVTWLMGELHQRAMENRIGSGKTNLMHLSVKVAHTSGVLNETIPHTPEELSRDILDLEHDVKTTIHNHKLAFLEGMEICKAILPESKCLQDAFKFGYEKSLSEMIGDLKKINTVDINTIDLKFKFADQVVINLKDSIKVKKLPKLKEPLKPQVDQSAFDNLLSGIDVQNQQNDGPLMCGGSPFVSEIEDITAFGFDISRLKYLTGGKKNTKYQKVKKIMDTFKDGIGGPGIKVIAFMKSFILNYKYGKASVCCEDTVDWRQKYGLDLSFYGGIEAKIGYNMSFLSYDLAGVGFLVGMGLSVGVGYTTPPVGCAEREHCAQGRFAPAVYGGGYIDALDGWVGGELKIVWRPYVVGRFCLLDPVTRASQDKFAKLVGDYKVGSIWLQGTLQVGWLTTYNYYKPIYTNDENNSFAFDVFP
jgi:hypothetical protein